VSEFHLYAKLIYRLSPFELCMYYTACCLQQIYDNLIAPMQIFFGFKHQPFNVFTEGEKSCRRGYKKVLLLTLYAALTNFHISSTLYLVS